MLIDPKICGKCKKRVDIFQEGRELMTIKGKKGYFTVPKYFGICPHCGEINLIPSLSDKFVLEFNKIQDNSEGFYLGSKVYKIIEIYNITAEEFSDLFDWDCKQWGIGMPRLKKDQINLFIREPMAFQFFLQANKAKISEESFNKVNTRLEKIISGEIDLNKEDDFDY